MIRINLLPVKAAQKKERLRGQLIIFGLSAALVAGSCFAVYGTYLTKVSNVKDEIATTEQDIQRLKKTLGEVAQFKKLQEELRGKLEILGNLKTARSGPVRLLDELGTAIPNRLWITSFKESKGSISIAGIGLNEETVAEFLRNLESSPYYQGVELKVIEQTAQGGQKLHKFDVSCRTENPQKQ